MSEKQNGKSWIKMYDISSEYQIIDKVGRGTYGTVYKAKNLKNGKYYAIKKLQNNDPKLQAEGFPITALRQISLLKLMQHDNIIQLKQIILSKPSKRNLYRGSTFLVFEYMDHDLAGLFKNKTKFNLSEIKCIIKQLIKGVAYLHSKRILHRDIKSANILLNDNGQVKLADFGLGRQCRADSVYTFKVVTLWYRAPELLLGCKHYDSKVDIWSIGCVLAEFLIGQVLFKRQTDFAQLERIYQICGGIEQNQIPQDVIKTFTHYQDLKPKKVYKPNLAQYLKKLNPQIDNQTISLLKCLLSMNPNTRYTCQQALQHPFFNTKPHPCRHYEIQKIDYECHEMFRDKTIMIERRSESYKRSSSYKYDKKDDRRDKKYQYKNYDLQEYHNRYKREDQQRKEYPKYQDKKQYRKNEGRYDEKYYKDDRREERRDMKRDDERKDRRDDRKDDRKDDKREYKKYERDDKREIKGRDQPRDQKRGQRRDNKYRYYQNENPRKGYYKQERNRDKRQIKYYNDQRQQSSSPSKRNKYKYKQKDSRSSRRSSYSSNRRSSSQSRDRSRDKEIVIRFKKNPHY